MASFKLKFIALLLLLLLVTLGSAHDLAPNHAPFYEKICEDVECGKGTCEANISYPLNYICHCDSGWLQNKDATYDDDHSFLPCTIPNCTLNYSCQPAPPPVQEKDFPDNKSFFNPCNWVYCGEGTCNKTSTYRHTCDCDSGYFNLLNNTHFPCYSKCTLGSDCASLGITEDDTSPSNSRGATVFVPMKLQWMSVLVMVMAMLVYK